MRRLGSLWWWAWALGVAVLCVYIAFDVLDLDASRIQQRSGAVITPETSSAEPDRLLRASALRQPVRLHSCALAAEAHLHLVVSQPRALRDGRPCARRHLPPLGCRGPEPSADPA